MTKWCSYGYFPPESPEVKRGGEFEDELLREYLPVILVNSERILDTPQLFYCQLADAWLSSMWLYGGGPIPLGVLLLLWDAGEMRFECPSCRGPLCAVGVSGSILSGCGSAWGVCAGCRQSRRHRGSISRAIRAVGNLLPPQYRNESVIERGKRPLFDWKDGLKGEFTPDKVLVPAVEAVDLWELICALTGRDLGQHVRKPLPEGISPRGLTHPILLEKKRS